MTSLRMTLSKSEYRHKLMFQKFIFFNIYLYIVWAFVIGIILTQKILTVNFLGKLTTYLAVSVFVLLLIIEAVRLTLGEIASTKNRVPEMGGFLLVTNLMQLPLVSFFLFNPYLKSTPTEIILTALMWMFAIVENVYGYWELKHASAFASSIYYAHRKEKQTNYQIEEGK